MARQLRRLQRRGARFVAGDGSQGGQRAHVLWTGPSRLVRPLLGRGHELLDTPRNELAVL